MYEEYLLTYHRADITQILEDENLNKNYSININFLELLERKAELANLLLKEPESNLEEWDNGVVSAQHKLRKEFENKYEVKLKTRCRIYDVVHLKRYVFPRSKDVGKYMQISGTVMRISSPKLLEYQRQYVCVKCKTPIIVKGICDTKYIIKQPNRCTNRDCNGTNLIHFNHLYHCKDYQEIKVQENVNKLEMGTIPSTIKVILDDDLVNCCQPGDDVTICGIVKIQFGEFRIGRPIEIELIFKANHIQVNTKSYFCIMPDTMDLFDNFWNKYSLNPLEGRDFILKSFCPELYGMYPVKLAIAVVLAGGCPILDSYSKDFNTRSVSHVLLVGDPGTGKSHLLRFASKVVPRAVLTTGAGTTAAGLTVTAIQENGEWQLEAGALVMADEGICCIDEFNSMKQHDRTAIHEAMEQQTISVAKASMVSKLKTRCSILAACNPKGNLDPHQSISMNVALPSPLLSRFDLVILLKDVVDKNRDELVFDHIVKDDGSIPESNGSDLWTIRVLQSYFKAIGKLRPKLSEDAELILSNYYNLQRRIESRSKARTTVRLLESLVRLSQGHARLMYHQRVEVMDSVYAVFLVDFSMDNESSVLNLNVASNSALPDYRKLLETVLDKLQLHDLLERELDVLNGTEKVRKEEKVVDLDASNGSVNAEKEDLESRSEIVINKEGGDADREKNECTLFENVEDDFDVDFEELKPSTSRESSSVSKESIQSVHVKNVSTSKVNIFEHSDDDDFDLGF